jgi:ABC-2 type transport system ATP-binding protein
VLLSSHILAEVQQVCSAATILGNGRTLATGSVAELIGSSTSQRVVAPDVAAARAALDAAGLRVTGQDGPALLVETDRPAEVTRVLSTAGVWLTELTPVRADLESIFLEVTEGEQLGGRIAWAVDGSTDRSQA